MNNIFLKPANGLIVPDPDNGLKPLPPEGAEVTENRYWKRRIAEGDAVLAKPAKTPSKT